MKILYIITALYIAWSVERIKDDEWILGYFVMGLSLVYVILTFL